MYKMPNFFTIPFLVNFKLLQQQIFALYGTTKGFSRFHYSLTAWMAEISLSEVSFFIMIPLQNCSNYQKCSILTTIAISAYLSATWGVWRDMLRLYSLCLITDLLLIVNELPKISPFSNNPLQKCPKCKMPLTSFHYRSFGQFSAPFAKFLSLSLGIS